MSTPFPAPTARPNHSPGQRPGKPEPPFQQALKGRPNPCPNPSPGHMFGTRPPFQGFGLFRNVVPRALPWAGLVRPFGVTIPAPSPRSATHRFQSSANGAVQQKPRATPWATQPMPCRRLASWSWITNFRPAGQSPLANPRQPRSHRHPTSAFRLPFSPIRFQLSAFSISAFGFHGITTDPFVPVGDPPAESPINSVDISPVADIIGKPCREF